MKSDFYSLKIEDENYPSLLAEISDPPEEIFIKGELPDAGKVCVAIVGTRKATDEGRALAKRVARGLAEKDIVIVSGLAMGIDTAAHEGALLAKTASGESGQTIAVLGCGIDTIYPAQNENLAGKILAMGGAVISEYPSGAPALPHQFLARNRIVAGLAQATIVIEAPEKSGALVTARLAAEYGREVFVFPGQAGHPQFGGSHALIRDGARLVNSIEDILEDLAWAPIRISSTPPKADLKRPDSNSEKQKILPFLGNESDEISFNKRNLSRVHLNILNLLKSSTTPLSVDKIIELSKLEPQEANRELTDLLLKGIIVEDGYGYKMLNG